MFIPEYSITPQTLQNISTIEYARAIIENTTILPSWENQMRKEARTRIIYNSLQFLNLNAEFNLVKLYVDQIEMRFPTEFTNISNALEKVEEISKTKEFGEPQMRELNKTLCEKPLYRNTKVIHKPLPEELLAKIVQFLDWYHSLDAQETHPLISAAITKAYLEYISLFKNSNSVTSNLASVLILKSQGYSFKDFFCLEDYYQKTKRRHDEIISALLGSSPDFTEWLEYFTEGLSMETSNIKEKIKLLARDTKVAKATGRVKFTPRQERIVEYLQDYGILQNRDFPRVFPDVSEDSILRDLKVLIEKNVVQKNGSTKSSRYELA